MADNISEDLHASNVACAHRLIDVGQRQATSAKACTHQMWPVRIGWETLVVACGIVLTSCAMANAHRP
ncbi:hypothetical protein H5410_019328 [Solanum commersonii]|uniref:Uncharacterized protein n=1 Tax=Solanum commersonii TaxID=4109 RepID=A0A9J5Z811_SOLCO|nr:hypothetical protein H5410_019328 [Solanum commersonii]